MKNNTGVIIQARMDSERLPEKSLKILAGKPLLAHIIERIQSCKCIDKIIVATSIENNDAPIYDLVTAIPGIYCFRGSKDNVLKRFYKAASFFSLNVIVRVTGDNPLIDYEQIDYMVEFIKEKKLDYVVTSNLPLGCGSEVLTFNTLKEAYLKSKSKHHYEHVTPYIYQNKNIFKTYVIESDKYKNIKGLRFTVDTIEDFQLMDSVYKKLYNGKPVSIADAVELVKNEPAIKQINKNIKQKSLYE